MLARFWTMTRKDGRVLRATDLDVDTTLTATGYEGLYNSAAGLTATAVKQNSSLAVDEIEVSGAMNSVTEFSNTFFISRADIEGGLWDQARVRLFEVDTDDLSTIVSTLLVGPIGRIQMTAEGEYRVQVRNALQLISQTMGETFSFTCIAVLGSGVDSSDTTPVIKRCVVDLTAFEVPGTVDTVLRDRYEFTSSDLTQDVGWFRNGKVRWTSGLNDTIVCEIRRHSVTGQLLLDRATPFPIAPDDNFVATPGCDHLAIYQGTQLVGGDCKFKFDNLANFRGQPFMPGADALLAGQGESL